MDKVKVAIIGLGNQGKHYLFDFFLQNKITDCVVTAVCDIDMQKLIDVKNKTENTSVAYFTDYKEMLLSGLCEAVLIETPHYLHPDIAIECLQRGIHVLCEKPAGVYAKQVHEMNEVAKKSKAVFSVMFNQRTNCVYRKMRSMIANGDIGTLQRVVWVITDWFRPDSYYRSDSWRATWNGEGGGVLINQCPHQLDLLYWILGEMPIAVRGFCQYGKYHPIEVEDDVCAYLEYANGASGVFITSTGEAPGVNRLEISGTKGKLVCEGDDLLWYRNEEESTSFCKTSLQSFAKPRVECVKVQTDGKNLQHVGIIQNFIWNILRKEELFVDGKEGIYGVQLMNAIEYSGWKGGERVEIPVKEDLYLRALKKHFSDKESGDNK